MSRPQGDYVSAGTPSGEFTTSGSDSAVAEGGELRGLSQYEELRLTRIARNEAKLRSLGLIGPLLGNEKKKKPVRKKSPSKPRVKPGDERRSPRTTGDGGNKKDPDKDYADAGEYQPEVSARSVRRRLKINRDKWKLSAEEVEKLKGDMDANYLDKFRDFLRYHDHISEQNERSVMKQVEKLARGDGIRYESPRYGWPKGCVFMKGEKVTPLHDIVELMERGQECEDEWGRDHGNGWLLSHPLKKLLLFQQFCLENPSFLAAESRIKEFVEEDVAMEEIADEGERGEKKASTTSADEVSKAAASSPRSKKGKASSPRSKKGKAVPKAKTSQPGKAKPAKAQPVNGERGKAKHGRDHTGARVARVFAGITYFGTITKFISECDFWCVAYDDGDEEQYDTKDLQAALSHYENNRAGDVQVQVTKNHMSERKTKSKAAPRIAPSASMPETRKSKRARTVTP